MADQVDRFFSDRALGMQASEIRELLKLTQKPDIISLAGGLPSPDAFPVQELTVICNDILKNHSGLALQYTATEGHMGLREALLDYMSNLGVEAEIDNTLITTGSQQGLSILSAVLLNPHEKIITGAPSYVGGLAAFRAFQAGMESVPLDDEGMRIDLLEEKLETLKKQGVTPKFIYVVPTFQNPAGLTMSEGRRKKLVELAHQYDTLIVEDDPYSKLRYEGNAVRPIKAFDDENRVIFMGTFSKLISPGLRVAWILAPKDLARKLVIAKQSADLCSTTFSQFIAYEFLKRGHLETHLQKIISLYKPKRDIILKALDEHFPSEAKWTYPEGGMFTWATLPEKVDTVDMFPKAVEKKVAYVIGSAFYPDKSGRNAMRLNFSFPSQEDIKEGIKRLGETIKEELKN